jgi:hypothetical protein
MHCARSYLSETRTCKIKNVLTIGYVFSLTYCRASTASAYDEINAYVLWHTYLLYKLLFKKVKKYASMSEKVCAYDSKPLYPRILISYKTRNEKATPPTNTHLLVQVEDVPT